MSRRRPSPEPDAVMASRIESCQASLQHIHFSLDQTRMDGVGRSGSAPCPGCGHPIRCRTVHDASGGYTGIIPRHMRTVVTLTEMQWLERHHDYLLSEIERLSRRRNPDPSVQAQINDLWQRLARVERERS